MGEKKKKWIEVQPYSVIFDVIGHGDYEGFIFAQCTSRKIARKALKILIERGWNNELLEIRRSRMQLNQLYLSDFKNGRIDL